MEEKNQGLKTEQVVSKDTEEDVEQFQSWEEELAFTPWIISHTVQYSTTQVTKKFYSKTETIL
jgi:hypothetical protein